MTLLRFFISILLMVCFGKSFAQTPMIDSLLQLPLITVSDSTYLPSTGITSVELDQEALAIYQSQSVASVLANEGLAFVKSYGIGSLATPSVRGGAAGQTAVFWNDLPIQSPMLGLLDLSLLPINGLGEVTLNYGGESAEWGSGAVSGGIHLQSQKLAEGLNAKLNSSIGSFGQWSEQGRIAYRNNKWGLALSGQWDEATNDFPYQIRADLPVKRLAHAELTQRATQQHFFWRPSPKQRLEFNAWQQQTERNLPPTTTQNTSLASQSDRIFRHVLSWQATGNTAIWKAKAGYFREELVYRNRLILLEAPSSFDTYLLRLDRSQVWRQNLILKTGLHYQYASAIADGYAQQQSQQQLALYQKAQWQITPRWSTDATARLEYVLNQSYIPAFDLRLKRQLGQQQQIYASLSRDFRLPTLNDRFWAQGGNPNLRTEYAWNQSMGIQGDKTYGRIQIRYELAAFNRQVEDWIQWSQGETDNFFSAGNIAEVWSRGLEPSCNISRKMGSGQLALNLRYHWIKSTYETDIRNPSITKGTQLWYTPEHQLATSLSYATSRWGFSYYHQWVDETNGINEDLAAYNIGSLHGHVNWGKDWRASCYFQFNNSWNTSYRVIERRPMPGRNIQVGMRLHFYKNYHSLKINQ